MKHVTVWNFDNAFRLMPPTIWKEHFDLIKWVWENSDHAGFDPYVICNVVGKSKERFTSITEDLMLILMICMERENSLAKIIQRSSKAYEGNVRSLKDIYHTEDSTGKGKNRCELNNEKFKVDSLKWSLEEDKA